jgi:hypothetical protein
VRVFHPVVQSLVAAVFDAYSQIPVRRSVALKLIGDHYVGRERGLIALLVFSFARIAAAFTMRVEDIYGLVTT